MKKTLASIIVLLISTFGFAQLTKERGQTAIRTNQAKEIETTDPVNISTRLKSSNGASVFGGKFKHSKVVIDEKPGSHTLYAIGMNGKLTDMYAIDAKGKRIEPTYSAKASKCFVCITIKDELNHCYPIDCNDLPMPKKAAVKLAN